MASKKKINKSKAQGRGPAKAQTSGKKPTVKGKSSPKKPAAKGAPAKKPVAAAKKPVKSASPVRGGKPSASKKAPKPSKTTKAAAPSKKELEREKKAKLLAKQAALKEQKAKLQAKKDAEREKKEKAKAKVLAQKEAEREKKEKAKAADLAKKAAEKARLDKEKEKERLRKEAEKARLDKEKEKERLRVEKEKERLRKEKEREAERIRKEKEKEKERLRKEKERERLEAQKKREEERLRKEKEREAYRKAREAERERVRNEREAARRALEGRIAKQQKEAQRIAGSSRGTSARVYDPHAIPSQARTTRDHLTGPHTPRQPARVVPLRAVPRPAVPPSAQKVRPPETLEERWVHIQERLAKMPEKFRREYDESFDMSWIHHDSALEGVVYTFQELKTAIDQNIVIVPDSSLQPVCEEIRRHKLAIDWVRELGKDSTPLSADILKKLYLILHPEEGDLKSVKYRKEIPQHRLYFHEYSAPDKIAVRIRQAFEWLHGPEPDKLKDPIRVAARLHYDLLRTFPFPEDSGKVSRMMMNILLLRAKLPPVILHSTERQRYYDALRGSLPVISQMVYDSVRNALTIIEKVLDDEDDKVALSNSTPAEA